MASYSHNFEGETDETVITTSTSGPNTFSHVWGGFNTVLVYDTARSKEGSASGRLATGITSTTLNLNLAATENASGELWTSVYLYREVSVAGNSYFLGLTEDAASIIFVIRIRADDTWDLIQVLPTWQIIQSSSGTIPKNEWVRFDLYGKTGIGDAVATARLFHGDDLEKTSSTANATEELTGTGRTADYTLSGNIVGIMTGRANEPPRWVDDLRISDEDWPAPTGSSGLLDVAPGIAQSPVTAYSPIVLDDSGTVTLPSFRLQKIGGGSTLRGGDALQGTGAPTQALILALAQSVTTAAYDPTVLSGPESIAPALAQSLAAAYGPTVIIDFDVTPTLAQSLAAAHSPTFATGAVGMTPTLAQSLTAAHDPTVLIGPDWIAAGLAQSLAAAYDPSSIDNVAGVEPALAQSPAVAFSPTVFSGPPGIYTGDAARSLARAYNPLVIYETNIFSDDFSRTHLGDIWTYGDSNGGDIGISDERLELHATVESVAAQSYTVKIGDTDQFVEGTYIPDDNGDPSSDGLMLRIDGYNRGDTYYLGMNHYENIWRIYKVVNGAPTMLAQEFDPYSTPEPWTGDRIHFRAVGDTLSILVNNELVLETTDSSITTGGHFGVKYENFITPDRVLWDDVRAGSIRVLTPEVAQSLATAHAPTFETRFDVGLAQSLAVAYHAAVDLAPLPDQIFRLRKPLGGSAIRGGASLRAAFISASPGRAQSLVTAFDTEVALVRDVRPETATQLTAAFDFAVTVTKTTVYPMKTQQLATAFSSTVELGATPIWTDVATSWAGAHGPVLTTGPVSVDIPLASALVTAFDPFVSADEFTLPVETAQSLVTAFDPSFTITVPVGLAQSLVAAFDPIAEPGAADVTVGLAQSLTVAFDIAVVPLGFVNPEIAESIASAPTPIVLAVTTLSVDLAQSLAVAYDFELTEFRDVDPSLATSLTTAFAPILSTGPVDVAADVATSLVTVRDPALTVGAVDMAPGLVQQLAVTFSPVVTPGFGVGLAQVLVSANTPTVTTRTYVDAGLAQSLAIAYDPTFVLTVEIEVAQSLAAAFDLSLTVGAVNVAAELAQSLAAAHNPALSAGLKIGLAQSLATALDVIVNLGPLPRLAKSLAKAFDPVVYREPVVTPIYPINGQYVDAPVTITGTVSADEAISAVKIRIYSRDSGLYWTGTDWGTLTNLETILSNPGGHNSNWSYVFYPPTNDVQQFWVPTYVYTENWTPAVARTFNFVLNPYPVEAGVAASPTATHDPTVTTTVEFNVGLAQSITTAHDPIIGHIVEAGVADASATVFDPAVDTSTSLELPIVQSLVTVYDPSLSTTVSPALASSLAAVYAPTVDSLATVGLDTIEIGLVYPPAVTTGPVSVETPLIDASATIHEASLAGVITPDTIDAKPTIYEPSLTLRSPLEIVGFKLGIAQELEFLLGIAQDKRKSVLVRNG